MALRRRHAARWFPVPSPLVGLLGTSVTRREDERFLRGRGAFVENLPLPGALWATFVRSPVASARVGSVDTGAARRAPGVVDVVTATDLDLAPAPPMLAISDQAMTRPWLAADRVRFAGEAVAVVLSGTRAEGADAAELVAVGYEPLPVVVDPEAALAPGAPLLFPEAGTNVALDLQFGRDEGLFDGCEVVVRRRLVNQRLASCPLEGRSAAAEVGADGRLTCWSSTQSAHAVRRRVAEVLGLAEAGVRVVARDVGGAFGSKMDPTPEEVLVAWLAWRAGRPVRWTETRSESMVSLGHGRGQVQHVEIGGTRAGRVLAYRLTVVQDAGAYPAHATGLPVLTRSMLTGVYDIGRAEFNAASVVTNTAPMVAYRGAGRPEATAAIERAVDLFAAEVGLDPAEVRRANLVRPDAFPYTNAVGTVYDTGDYDAALDRALAVSAYTDRRAEQARRRAAGGPVVPGIGLSMYVEVTAGPSAPDEWGAVAVGADGRVTARTGCSPHGQGHQTGFAMVVADALGLAVDDVDVVFGDTDLVPTGVGTMGSRSLQTGGVALRRAAAEVVARAAEVAAGLLGVAPGEVELNRETWGEVAAAAVASGRPLAAEVHHRGSGFTFAFGAHVAEVDVDVETGRVELRRLVAVDDAGRILNPTLAEGQVHGGLAQGAAQALWEEVRYGPEGSPLTATFADYALPSAADLPSFESVLLETPTPANELGAKGIGESGAVGAPPAVQNAVVDALAHLGVRHLDMPCTPESVWRALGR